MASSYFCAADKFGFLKRKAKFLFNTNYKVVLLCDMMPCSIPDDYRRFGDSASAFTGPQVPSSVQDYR
jgi:hypothetical protein